MAIQLDQGISMTGNNGPFAMRRESQNGEASVFQIGNASVHAVGTTDCIARPLRAHIAAEGARPPIRPLAKSALVTRQER